ncbi:MAG TPA: dethiobiotin synthase [Acidimicrobiia bacterium]|nr:dethiobiotin synthase [Acidimicrobiia bacterium]
MIRFVTGTDTGVGKTLAAAALCRAEREAGRTVLYAKPVQTGLAPAEAGDAAFVAAAAAVPVVECLRFPEPLAPAVAAERAGAVIDVDGLLADLAKAGDGFDRVVVEGAGGLLVPLWAETTMADLADRLGAGLVVVTRPGLGTLNHTALTLEAARARGLPVDGLVISGWPVEPGVTERTNLERLAALAPVLGVLPAYAGLDTAEPATAPPDLSLLAPDREGSDPTASG